MEDPNITMEEYIRLEEEKAQKCGKVFNWKTTKYGKIWYDEDVHELRSVKTEFPAIVFNDELSSEKTLPCEPTVSSLNDNEIDFRISYHESDDEYYTIIFDKNTFSYKIISANDLKTDLENDNEKVNMPLFPSPEPSVSCFDDLDFFKEFENEFPAIVYNDALMSKSDFLIELTLSPQHIDEFYLKDETSLSECDEEEQNILYFNDLFHFNIIYPDDLKSDKDNDDDKIDIIQSSGGNVNIQGSNMLLETSYDKINKNFNVESFVMELNINIVAWNYLVNGMLFNLIKNLYVSFDILFDPKRYYKDGIGTKNVAEAKNRMIKIYTNLVDFTDMALLHRDQRHQYLRFEGLRYTDADIADFEARLARIYRRELGGARRHLSWRQFILALGLHTAEEMEIVGFGAYWAKSARQILDKGNLRDYWIRISSAGDFLGTTPSNTSIRDSILRPCHILIACSIAGRSQAPEKEAMIFGGQDVARLAEHFGLLTEERLQRLTVIVRDLPIINMAELVRLQIYEEIDDTWAWVAPGPERQPDAAAGANEAAKDAPAIDEGAQADIAPVQAPQPPPPPKKTMPQRSGRLDEEIQGLRQDVGSLCGLVERSLTDHGRFSTWMISCMTQLMEASGQTYQAFDGTFRGSSLVVFERRTKQKTSKANTSTTLEPGLLYLFEITVMSTMDLDAVTCLNWYTARENVVLGTVFGEPPYPFNYPTRRLTMEEMLAKIIDEGRREHEEMEIFIKEFRTTNDLLLKTRSNLLSELKIEEKPHDDGVENKSLSILEKAAHPLKHKEAEDLAAYHLSRFESSHIEVLTERKIVDKFSDENLMVLKSNIKDDEPWYADFVNYIVGKVVPPNWTFEKRKRFFSQVKTYFWEEPYAFKLCTNNIMRRCVAGSETLKILAHCHSGPIGGHHSANITAKKVYESRFYWPSVFKDANEYGLDFMGPFPQYRGNKYILVAVDYVSKWVEAQALPTNDAHVVVKFLRSLFARFGVPKALISDRGTHFCNSQLEKALQKYCMTHKLSMAYHPQSNGQIEVTNRAIKRILERSVCESRLMQLNELAELRDGAYENTRIYKERTKKWHDSRLRGDKDFKVGDKVLLYNSRLKMYPGKLKSKWSGPNIVKTVYPHGAIEITDRDGFSFKVNGQRLKKYYGGDIDKEDDEVIELENDATRS
ncbi:reverse transcriptase domain-containing protein [Tanacetum coccineum]